MNGFDELWLWRDPELSGSLPWYRRVAANRAPAKFRIYNQIPAELDLNEASEEALVRELDARTPAFLALCQRIREGDALPAGGRAQDLGLVFETMSYEKNSTGIRWPSV